MNTALTFLEFVLQEYQTYQYQGEDLLVSSTQNHDILCVFNVNNRKQISKLPSRYEFNMFDMHVQSFQHVQYQSALYYCNQYIYLHIWLVNQLHEDQSLCFNWSCRLEPLSTSLQRGK